MTSDWPIVSLGELIRLERRPVVVEPDREYAEIGTYSFGRGVFHKRPRSGLEVGDKSLFLIKEGDFVLQITFAWEGAVALMSKAEDGLYGSVRYLTFRVDESCCLPRFLLNYFRTEAGRQQLERISPGSAGRNRVLNVKRVPEVSVPLPPLAEQLRIISLVERIEALADEAIALRRDSDNEIQSLCRAILSHDGDAKLMPMRDLVRLRQPDVVVVPDETYQFAGVYSFGRGVFRGQQKSGMEFAYPRLTRLKAGEFTYPKLMAWEGALGVVPTECDGCVVSTEFPVFEVMEERVYPEVLDAHFKDPRVWPSLSGVSTGTNVRRRRLNPLDFLSIMMPVPSRRVQEQFREIRVEIDRSKELRGGALSELETLRAAVLSQAFRGEL
jgi:type I restriction enzyme S subunit